MRLDLAGDGAAAMPGGDRRGGVGGCGHARRVKPGHLVVDRGDLSLAKLQSRFKCRRCNAQRAAIVLHDEAGPGR